MANSGFEKEFAQLLRETYPALSFREQFPVKFRRQQLYFDFCIPALRVLVEIQGPQHYKFNAFFHRDGDSYRAALRRDRLKAEWSELDDWRLIVIPYTSFPMTTKDLAEVISPHV